MGRLYRRVRLRLKEMSRAERLSSKGLSTETQFSLFLPPVRRRAGVFFEDEMRTVLHTLYTYRATAIYYGDYERPAFISDAR